MSSHSSNCSPSVLNGLVRVASETVVPRVRRRQGKIREIRLADRTRVDPTIRQVLHNQKRDLNHAAPIAFKPPHAYQNKLEYSHIVTSCAIMNEVNPSLQSDFPFPPQFLHREPECLRRSFVVRRPSRIRERRLVKILRQIPTIFVDHRPHRAQNAAESAVLHRSRQVKPLVHDTSFSHLSRVTSRKKREFGSVDMGAHDLE
jgi:hypothetical protein